MNRAMRNSGGCPLVSLACPGGVREESNVHAAQIAPGFANLAGSRENALALVQALHDGKRVTLAFGSPFLPEVFDIGSPTGPMSWKDVRMALMLARDALLRYGIIHPSGVQFRAALTGGQAAAPNGRPVNFRGVLPMRAEGMNWGRIAAERFRRPEVTSLQAPSLPPELLRA